MGDFSRDTFRLTNVMHTVLTGAAVPDARHYVAVRTQQGVPVLDADVNEAADIARATELIRMGSFYGDGVPSGSDGFGIGPVTEDDDFSIGRGVAMVGGALVFNPFADLTYKGQALALGVAPPPLAAPGAGVRDDLAYLDVWEEEVRAAGSDRADDRLVHPAIGVETCTRLERRWTVRVAPGVTDMAVVPPVAGHLFMPLARLRRTELEPRIQARRITDLRRTDLNVAKHLRVPVSAARSGVVVDSEKLAQLLEALRSILNALLAGGKLFVPAAEPARTLHLFALQHVLQVCSTGAMQAATRTLDNAGALAALTMVFGAQTGMVQQVDDLGPPGAQKDDFVAGWEARLAALSAELADGDLVGAYQEQQAINAWLSASQDVLPEGSVSVQYLSAAPAGNLAAGVPVVITVEVTSLVVFQGSDDELFDLTAELSSDLWTVQPQATSVVVANEGGTAQVQFTVTPNGGNAECTLTVRAEARDNPVGVKSSQPGIALVIGEPAPVGATVFYAGPPPLNEDGELLRTVAQITFAFGGTPVNFGVANRTDDPHTYRLRWWVVLPAGVDDAAWTPRAAAASNVDVPVAAGVTHTQALAIKAPAGTAAGTTGTVHVELVRIDADDIPQADRETVDLPFRVTA